MANCGVTWALFYGDLELLIDMNDDLPLSAEAFAAVVRPGCTEVTRRLAAWPGETPVLLSVVAWFGNATVYEERFACGTGLAKGSATTEVRAAFTLLLQQLERAAGPAAADAPEQAGP